MKQLSWTDAAMVWMESSTAPLHVNPVLIYDPSTAPGGRVTFKAILQAIEERLHLAPSFRRRLAHAPGGLIAPFWVEDDNFDLEYHVRHIALPKPGDWRQFCIQIARLHARPLDLSRPPWELTVIEGLDKVEGLPKGCFAISLKVHHAAIDGVEGVSLINAIHDLSPLATASSPPERTWTGKGAPSRLTLVGQTATSGIRYPVQATRTVTRAVPAGLRTAGRALLGRRPQRTPAPRTRFNGTITPHRVFEARFHDFEDIRRIKAAVQGATVNDVAVAYVGGALRHYLEKHAELPDSSMVALCPVSIRTPDQAGSGGNQLSLMRVAVRNDIADPLERLAAITEVTSVDRIRRQGVGAPLLLDLAELLPGALVGVGSRATTLLTKGPQLANVAITNVPGSRAPLYFAGARLVRLTGNGPVYHGLGLIHLVSSYVNDFSIAITGDRSMLPDPSFYAECLQRSFDELLAAATAID